MRKPVFKILRATCALILLAGMLAAPAQAGPTPPASLQQLLAQKADPWVIQNTQNGEAEFLVYLTEQADLSEAAALPNKQEKGRFVYQQLTQTANRTQPGLLSALERAGAAYQPYWVANMVLVRGSSDLVMALVQRPDVAHLYANPSTRADMGSLNGLDNIVSSSQTAENVRSPQGIFSPDTVEWNISKVNAPQVWAAGYTGQGVVIAGQDTGYKWDHPALIQQYRGSSGNTVDHNYNWHDAIHEIDPHLGGTNPCGLDAQAPCDDHGHGTHTMGTMVGSDGASNSIGMAPGARWIGCRNMERGYGTPGTYAECFQWFIAPTSLDPNNPNPNPDLAPDIINNSWGCPVSEGCTDPNVLLSVVNSVTAAGILTVHSAGNEGYLNPSNNKLVCSTISTPAAIYASALTVANTTQADVLATSSSIGPIAVDNSLRRKPDVAAPGTSVRSSYIYSPFYATMSGTSMAAPHVAGLAALILSARSDLKGQVAQLRQLIEQSASPVVSIPGSSTTCGGTNPTQIPNNFFGWGRIDAQKALQAALTRVSVKSSSRSPAPGEVITVTVTITNSNPAITLSGIGVNAMLPNQLTNLTSSQPLIPIPGGVAWTVASLSPLTSTQTNIRGTTGLCAKGSSTPAVLILGTQIPTLNASAAQMTFDGLNLTSEAPSSAAYRGLINYTFHITGTNAPKLASTMTLSSTLPAGLSFIDATPGYHNNGSVVTWQLTSQDIGTDWQASLTARIGWQAANPLVGPQILLQAAGLPNCSASPVSTALFWTSFMPNLWR